MEWGGTTLTGAGPRGRPGWGWEQSCARQRALPPLQAPRGEGGRGGGREGGREAQNGGCWGAGRTRMCPDLHSTLAGLGRGSCLLTPCAHPQTSQAPAAHRGRARSTVLSTDGGEPARERGAAPPPLGPSMVPSTPGFSSPQINLALVAQRRSGPAPSPSLIPEGQTTTH